MAKLKFVKFSIPKRIITVLMGSLGIAFAFTMRLCLSIAITEMVIPLNHTTNANHSFECSFEQQSTEQIKQTNAMGTRFDWSQETQGWILSSFYIGYPLSHILGGIIAEKFTAKWTFSLAILSIAAFSIVTPLAVDYGGHIAMIALRILMGIASGMTFPALTVLVAAWVPAKERSKLGAIALGGSQIGSILSFYVSGIILSIWPWWPAVFYFWGAISIVWFVLFTRMCFENPNCDPHITQDERDYLVAEMGQLQRNKDLPLAPWSSILRSVPVLAFICAQLGHDFTSYVIMSDLPKYFKEVLGLPVYDVGLYNALPHVLMLIISLITAFLCDHLISKHYLTTTRARKMFTFLSGVPPAIFIVAASYAGCDKLFVVFWFILAVGFMGNYYCSLKINALDLSFNYAGSLAALINGSGAITGIIAPVFVGMMTPNSSLEEWRVIFWCTFGLNVARVIIFLIYGSAEIQPWNEPKERLKSPECNKVDDDTENIALKSDSL